MCGGLEAYEAALRERRFRAIAMSVFASGAIPAPRGDRVGLRPAEHRVDRLRRLERAQHPEHPRAGRPSTGVSSTDHAPRRLHRRHLKQLHRLHRRLDGSRARSAGPPSTRRRAARCSPARRSTSCTSSAAATRATSCATFPLRAASCRRTRSTRWSAPAPRWRCRSSPSARARRLALPLHRERGAQRGPVDDGAGDARIPGVRLYAQYPAGPRDGWRYRGSVFDSFAAAGTRRAPAGPASQVVVSLGTYRATGSRDWSGACSRSSQRRRRCCGRPATPTPAGSASTDITRSPSASLIAGDRARRTCVVAHAGRRHRARGARGRQVPDPGPAPPRPGRARRRPPDPDRRRARRPRPPVPRRRRADARTPARRRGARGERWPRIRRLSPASNRMPGDEHMSDLDGRQRNLRAPSPSQLLEMSRSARHLRLARRAPSTRRRESPARPGALVTSCRQFTASPESRELICGAHSRLAEGLPIISFVPSRYAGAEEHARGGRPSRSLGLSSGRKSGRGRDRRGAASRPGSQLQNVNSYCPPFGYEDDQEELERIREAVRGARPALVLVGLGFPKQEKLISWLRYELPQTWFVGVGISLSFLAGEQPRAPAVLQRLGSIEPLKPESHPSRVDAPPLARASPTVQAVCRSGFPVRPQAVRLGADYRVRGNAECASGAGAQRCFHEPPGRPRPPRAPRQQSIAEINRRFPCAYS